MKHILTAVLALVVASSAQADDVELEADLEFYGGTIFIDESCAVEIVAVSPDVEKIYIENNVVAVITFVDETLTFIETYIDDILTETKSYNPFSEESVLARNDHIDRILQQFGKPTMREMIDPAACLYI